MRFTLVFTRARSLTFDVIYLLVYSPFFVHFLVFGGSQNVRFYFVVVYKSITKSIFCMYANFVVVSLRFELHNKHTNIVVESQTNSGQ